jgi:hypothetical protein
VFFYSFIFLFFIFSLSNEMWHSSGNNYYGGGDSYHSVESNYYDQKHVLFIVTNTNEMDFKINLKFANLLGNNERYIVVNNF